jgi:hypothetical protein
MLAALQELLAPLVAERLRDNALSVAVQSARAAVGGAERVTSGRKKGVVIDNDCTDDQNDEIPQQRTISRVAECGAEGDFGGDSDEVVGSGSSDELQTASKLTAARQSKLRKLAAQRQQHLFVVRSCFAFVRIAVVVAVPGVCVRPCVRVSVPRFRGHLCVRVYRHVYVRVHVDCANDSFPQMAIAHNCAPRNNKNTTIQKYKKIQKNKKNENVNYKITKLQNYKI